MIADLWKMAKSFVTLADTLERYHTEIKDIRLELRDLTIIVHALAQDIKNSKEQADKDRQILLLEVEKKLISLERGLPTAISKTGKKRGKKR